MIFAAALLATALLLIAGATRVAAQGAGEVEVSFSSPQVAAPYSALAIFVNGVPCADLPVDSLNMPVILGAGCIEEGATVDFLLYSADGAQAVRLVQQFEVAGSGALVVDNWETATSVALPAYMSTYVETLDGSDPASVVSDDDDAADDVREGTPGLPEVGNYGFTEPGTSPLLILGALAVAMALVTAGRRTTRPLLAR